FLASVGVAAVAALLVAALVGVLEPPAAAAALTAGPLGPRSASALTAALGVAATLGVYRWRRDVAAATLLGAAAYGLAWWLVTGVGARAAPGRPAPRPGPAPPTPWSTCATSRA